MRLLLSLMLFGQAVMAADFDIERLLAGMTPEEKAGQLNLMTGSMDVTGVRRSRDLLENIRAGHCGGVFNVFTPQATHQLQKVALSSRLKIPLLFGYDVIHGHRTIYPIPLGLSSSWNPDLIRRCAAMAAREAAADGLNWVFSPMVDISQDARWGRVAEGAGEDPWLASRIARAMVEGYQGEDVSASDRVAACVKHFAIYGAAQAGRDYNVVDMSRRAMEETWFPPYRAAVDAGARTVMASFNEVNGVPATANRWLLRDVLRDDWGFSGMVVSDYTAIEEMIPHGYSIDGRMAARQALQAGLDMDMVSGLFERHLPGLLKANEITEAELDQAVRRVLELKRDLGLFRDPFLRCDDAPAKREILSEENRRLAREAARESIVLFKNERNALPLDKAQTVAIIGPLADHRRAMLGCWSAAGDDQVAASPLDGIRALLGSDRSVLHARGSNVEDSDSARGAEEMLAEAERVAGRAAVVILVLGESPEMSGEAASRADIRLPKCQRKLARRMLATGKPCILVVMSGRPLDLSWEDANFPAIIESWALGTEGGHALAEVLFGEAAPVGKLTMGFPRAVGQLPMTYRAKNTGRPSDARNRYTSKYLDVPNDALYPFGHGLTYGSFDYGPVTIDSETMKPGGMVTVSATLTNRSEHPATETMQLYLRDRVGSVTRPVKELRGYQRVTLEAGETRVLRFEIRDDMLAFPGPDLKPVVEPGEFEAMVGPDSANVRGQVFTRSR